MVVVGKYRNQTELRQNKRQNLRYAATLLIDQDGTTQPCRVADISETGARLITDESTELPEQFILVLTPMGEVRRVCRLIWRDGKRLGVRFVNSETDS
ncbi:MAG TPA: PilZ domain-containing protein [Xanthobacteraceae bacterium]|nr:PilZ domain-containing protein [Xanthobacteraceae bacterium]